MASTKQNRVRSMTGFGRGEASLGSNLLTVEVRTVNHRFLEISNRLPKGMMSLEHKLRGLLQDKLGRGKVNITVTWTPAEGDGAVAWDHQLAESYYRVLQEVRDKFEFREPVTLSHVLAHPNLLSSGEPHLEDAEAWKILQKVTTKAIEDLVSMRDNEGEALVRDLLPRLETIRTSLRAVEKRSPERAKEAREKLQKRVAELLDGEAEVDQDRLLIEASFQAERMDATEECTRLDSHLDQFKEVLEAGGQVGRKLNFLLQEMNREANTIGSKANDVSVAREVIQLKEEIEILREQIQNLE